MKQFFLIFIVLSCTLFGYAQKTNLIQNIAARNTISLNGSWSYIVDVYETGYYNFRGIPIEQSMYPDAGFMSNIKQTHKSERLEYEFSKYQTLNVPGDWNSQVSELKFYEGTVWYQKDFNIKKIASKKYFIYFGAVNYDAKVYINGKSVGTHIGGFTAFNFDITKYINDGGNFVVVKVDNVRKKEAIPTTRTDWWNYGGITRDVFIAELDETFIVDYKLQLLKGSKNTLSFYAKLAGENQSNKTVKVIIPEIGLKKSFLTNSQGEINSEFIESNLQLWNPENPKLYSVHIISEEENIKDKIGFRTIETKGTDILLNGKPIFLRGISIHKENPLREARATGQADARILLGWAKDLNCNYVRLAHYPHNEHMLKLADEIGLLVWSEIPVYWSIDWENKKTKENAHQQLSEMISRDKNRASTIIWSIGNETPVTLKRLAFMSDLAKKVKILDNTRLVSAALELHQVGKSTPNTSILEDPLSDYLDIMSFNEYIGWYGHKLDEIATYTLKFKQQKPVLVSEFGAGALYGFHADKETRWSEEYQAELYKQQLKMIDNHPQIKGTTPWILVDFKSPNRLHPTYQNSWNRKGLISNNGQKKQAFEVLKKYYAKKRIE